MHLLPYKTLDPAVDDAGGRSVGEAIKLRKGRPRDALMNDDRIF